MVIVAHVMFVCSFAQTPADTQLAVDIPNGGLSRVATVLTARHGVPINFEGVPGVIEGVSYTRVTGPTGGVSRRRTSPPLAFEYESTATPRQVAEAAVSAWNGLPRVEAHYQVLEESGVLHFVPTEVLTADGTYAPYVPLFDREIVLEQTTGEPTALYRHLVTVMTREGLVVTSMDADLLLGSALPPDDPESGNHTQRVVTLPNQRGSVRELLDALLATSDVQTHWWLHWYTSEDPSQEGWRFAFDVAKPEDEGPPLNRTPMVP